jgi:serine/threonine protein kinase
MIVNKRQLGQSMTEGGEAIIYPAGNNLLKIFKPHINLAQKQSKVTGLMKSRLPSQAITPIDIATDSQKKFLGYVMPAVQNAESFHQLTKNKYCRLMKLDTKVLMQTLIDLGKAIQEVHKAGWIIGDLSDNNILYNGKVHLVDTDSWGNKSLKLIPDAYTDGWVPPEVYTPSGVRGIDENSDNYSYAILAFNVLTKIHPFGGIYDKDQNMNILERMKNRLSIIGNKDITLPKMITSFNWINPAMLDHLKKMFDGNNRELDPVIAFMEEQNAHSKRCPTCGSYYYDRYTSCPVCDANAALKKLVNVIKTSGKFRLIVQFESPTIDEFLDFNTYIDMDGNIKNIHSVLSPKPVMGWTIRFNEDGTIFSEESSTRVKVGSSVFEKKFGTQSVLKSNDLYFVDAANQLTQMRMSQFGNAIKVLRQVNNPIFEVADDGELIVVDRYTDKFFISTDHYNTEVKSTNKIKNYFLQKDKISKSWLFVYEQRIGKFRSIVIDKEGKIIADRTDAVYKVASLTNMYFINNTVYEPADGKILARNLVKDSFTEFTDALDILTGACSVKFDKSNNILVLTENKIYRYEKN